jgi:hypothetical protein
LPKTPKISVVAYRHDVTVKIHFSKYRQPDPAPRSECRTWSKKSRRRLMFVAQNTDVTFRSMVTLTYPAEFPRDGKVVKKHLHLMLKWLQYHLDAPNYLWFFEWQGRGAPHVHILLESALRGVLSVDDVSAAWYRICGTGDEKHLFAGTRCESLRKQDGAIRYALKYASKMRQKRVPDGFVNVGRMWGHSRDVAPAPRSRASFASLDELREALATWPKVDVLDEAIYRTLYGAAEYFKVSHSRRDSKIGGSLDDGKNGYQSDDVVGPLLKEGAKNTIDAVAEK